MTFLLALALPAYPALASDCSTVLFAELPMRIDAAGGVTVPVTISGQTLNMLIDTGGIGSMLTSDAVTKMGGQPYSIVDAFPTSSRTEASALYRL